MQLLVIQFTAKMFQLLLKYLCNLARYWFQAPWGWHDNVETCSSVIICEIIVHLLVIVKNTKLYYQQLHLKYLCNLARYSLQVAWGWHDSVETCSSVIICEIIVHLLVTVQNNKRCAVHVLKQSTTINIHDLGVRSAHCCFRQQYRQYERHRKYTISNDKWVTQSHNCARRFMWVWNLVSRKEGEKIHAEGVWE